MTGSQTIRTAAREMYAGTDFDAPTDLDMTDSDYQKFFELLERITNDRLVTQVRHRRQFLENIALRFESDTALEEFVGWFNPPASLATPLR